MKALALILLLAGTAHATGSLITGGNAGGSSGGAASFSTVTVTGLATNAVVFNRAGALTAVSTFSYTPAGNMGIGTASPTSLIHVLGGGVSISTSATALAPSLLVDASNGNVAIRASAAISNSPLYIKSPASASVNDYPIRIDNLAASNRYLFGIEGNAASMYLYNASAVNTVKIVTNGDSFFNAAGNVGIGTTAPATTLDVNGNAQFGTTAKSSFTTAGYFQLLKRTKAQLDAVTPAVGDQVLCSDCAVPYDLCIATGATLSGWRATINSAINTTIPGTLVSKGCGTNN